MLNINKKERAFARRLLILGSIKGVLFLILTARLYYLQIIKSNKYRTYSDSNRTRLSLIPPYRGKILDRNNVILATNKNYYRILFERSSDQDPYRIIERIVSLLSLDEDTHKHMVNTLNLSRRRRRVQLLEHLSWQQVARIEAHIPDLPGVSIDVAHIRDFTTKHISAHLIGYLGPISQKEIDKNPLLNHPDFKIGRSGVERLYEHRLRGKAGIKRSEVNAFGLTVNELSREESTPGDNITLTLDKALQEFVGERIKEEVGTVVVLDTQTGGIVSLVSTPSFDPNAFTYGVDAKYWNTLIHNPDKPMVNKALSSQYPPGSTFKLIVALAALKDGINPTETHHCTGSYKLGRRRFRCWKEAGHGTMTMEEAIMHSCNTYFYHIAKQLGVEKIAAMAREFGLGETINIGLPAEKSGLIPTAHWKKQRFNIPWQAGDTLNTCIGQGFVLTTPLQLATFTARLATGKLITPHILLNDSSTNPPDIPIPESHLHIVRKGMYDVVNTQGGTAFWSRTGKRDFELAGKTGTSQVISKERLKENFGSMTEAEKRRTQNHALFVGYAPFKTPRYAISVVIEHGGSGSKSAAPIARDIMKFLYEYEQKQTP